MSEIISDEESAQHRLFHILGLLDEHNVWHILDRVGPNEVLILASFNDKRLEIQVRGNEVVRVAQFIRDEQFDLDGLEAVRYAVANYSTMAPPTI